jgi:integrase
MLLRTLLHDRYAILKNLSERSVAVYAITLLWFDRYLVTREDRAPGAGSLDDLDDLVVAGFLRWRATQIVRTRRVSPATVAKDRVQLLSLWTFAAKKRMKTSGGEQIDFPSLPQAKTIHRIPVAYTVEEIRRMIAIARTRKGETGPVPSAWWWSTLLGVAFLTGERIGALLQLRWGQIDLQRRRITFLAETRKGGRQDIVRQITPAMARELAAHAAAPDVLVWPWPRNPLSIYASMKKICLRAAVTPRGFHAIRKSSASYIAAGGGDASAHLGHSDPSIARDHYLDPRIMPQASEMDFLPTLDPVDAEPADAEFIPDEDQ